MARRRLAWPSTLPMVISGSATRRSSFALGKVVRMSSCLIRDAAILVNIALRCELVRLNLRPDFWWRMVVFLKYPGSAHHALLKTGRWPVFQLHAESQSARGQHFFDFSE